MTTAWKWRTEWLWRLKAKVGVREVAVAEQGSLGDLVMLAAFCILMAPKSVSWW